MNENEARTELKRFSHRKFRLYFGIAAGIEITLVFLSLSFIRAHIDFILDMWFYPSVVFLVYCFYMINKLRKIDEVLRDVKE